MFKKCFSMAVLSFCACSVYAQKLVVGVEGNFPPFSYTTAQMQVEGFDIDITRAVCIKMQIECELVAIDWDGLIPALQTKKIDIIVASMSVTEERKQALDFSNKYYTNKLQFVAPKDIDFKTDTGYLQGKNIGTLRSTLSATYMEDNLDGIINMYLYDTQENAYLDLRAGRLDGILTDIFVQIEWLKSDAGKNFELKGEPVYEQDEIAIAMRKNEETLLVSINKALAEIIGDGTYKEINDKYFPVDIY